MLCVCIRAAGKAIKYEDFMILRSLSYHNQSLKNYNYVSQFLATFFCCPPPTHPLLYLCSERVSVCVLCKLSTQVLKCKWSALVCNEFWRDWYTCKAFRCISIHWMVLIYAGLWPYKVFDLQCTCSHSI